MDNQQFKVIMPLNQMSYGFDDVSLNFEQFEQNLAYQYNIYYHQEPKQALFEKDNDQKQEAITSYDSKPQILQNLPQLKTIEKGNVNQKNGHQTNISKKKDKKQTKKNQDKDYSPRKRKNSSKKSKKVLKQKENRNIIPNSVQNILVFAQKRFKSGLLVEKIFAKYNKFEAFTVERYYVYHKLLRTKINSYVNEHALQLITEPGEIEFSQFGRQEQLFYCSISRTLIRYYLKEEARLHILTSRKVKRENVLQNLHIQRYLLQYLQNSLLA